MGKVTKKAKNGPLLSIGMIFKNEIRCLERCMESLAPLRAAVPCELVMADTGSTDGSREVAEKYADILFDFPWTDDFSAARNAVMDRCSGTWYFSIDADEWLDMDLRELLYFLRNKGAWTGDVAGLIVRNYTTEDLGETGTYVDMIGVRLVRMAIGARYEGIIHEKWEYPNGRREKCVTMRHQILHHDGYVGALTTAAGALKRHRNMTLLKKQLESGPDNLRTWMECIESSDLDPDHLDYVRGAVEKVRQKVSDWEMYGAPIIRHAVNRALMDDLAEADEWIQIAEEWFPDSLFTILDVGYLLCRRSWMQGEYTECVHRCEKWLADYAQYAAGEGDQSDLLVNALKFGAPRWAVQVKIYLVNAYLLSKSENTARMVQLAAELSAAEMDTVQIGNAVRAFGELHAATEVDTVPLIKRFYDQLTAPQPTAKAAEARLEAFEKAAYTYFQFSYLRTESGRPDAKRQVLELFAPLPGDIGAAVYILGSEDVEEIAEKLSSVEKWDTFPASALLYALEKGVQFPPPGRVLQMEELDALAGRLSEEKGRYLSYVSGLSGSTGEGMQALAWAKSLVLAALPAIDWTDGNSDENMAVCRLFAEIEGEFIPKCYASEALTEHLFLLPPLHRFGWYSAQAFDSLEKGDAIQYVRLLKKGLSEHPGAKPMVKFLTENTPELRRPEPSKELLALAEQIRGILSAYSPDDPAVTALKSSPAYQEVVHLIEGPEIPVFGKMAQ